MRCQEKDLINLDFDLILGRILTATILKNRSQVANSIGIKEQALNNYKNQKKWPIVTLYKLAVAHGLSLDWLLSGEEPMRRENTLAAHEEPAVYTTAAEKYADVFTQVREILESGDDFVIKALKDRIKDYRLAVSMNAERRNLRQRLTVLEQEVKAIRERAWGRDKEEEAG